MDIQEILTLPLEDALKLLAVDIGDKEKGIAENRKAYAGDHEILHDPNRTNTETGDTAATKRVVKHTKEVINYQRRIVNSAVTFLFGEPVTLVLNNKQEKALDAINALWKQNKLDYVNKAIARDLFVECKAAEVWNIPKKIPGQPARVRVTVLGMRNGYRFYPHYDEYGDMDAFTVLFTTTGGDGKPVENAKIYTASNIIHATKKAAGAGWTEESNVVHDIGKIPVVYYEQDVPEWQGVETQIGRDEDLVSNFADTNDYFGAPVLQSKGIIDNLPKKEDSGKVVTVRPETDDTGKVTYPGGIEFITWANAPAAIELEHKMLKDMIYSLTQTPDLSFSNVKGISAISGIALRLMFSDALFKSRDKQEIFGPALDRRISVMKAVLAVADTGMRTQLEDADIDVIFNDVLPEDTESIIKSLSIARGGEPIISTETAVSACPFVKDTAAEVERLEKEQGALQNLGESYEA